MSSPQRQFLEALVQSMHCDPAVLSQAGVTVKASPGRAESHVTAGYRLGEHFIITCDPAVEELLTNAVAQASMLPTLAAWNELAEAQGGELLGAGRMQVHPTGQLADEPLADGYVLRALDTSDTDDLALIAALIERSSEDDLDEAEIEMENLDDVIEVVLDQSGQIASYASTRDFDLASGFGDIGIMTRPDCRGIGLGSSAVASICRRITDNGDVPLYRCQEDNTGSVALSASLGFEVATQLVAYRFGEPTE